MGDASTHGRSGKTRRRADRLKLRLVPKLVVQTLRKHEGRRGGTQQNISTRGHIEVTPPPEESDGLPHGGVRQGLSRVEPPRIRRAGFVRGDFIQCPQGPLAALDVERSAIDITSGANDKIAAAVFQQIGCVRCKITGCRGGNVDPGHAGRGRDGCIGVDQITCCGQADITAAKRAEALEKIAVIDPPRCRGREVGDATALES